MSRFEEELMLALNERQAQQRYRQRSILSSPQNANVIVNGQPYLAFCSNDYLGLANHPEVIHTLQKTAEISGVGSGASHLVHGHSEHHHQLEEAIAAFTGRQRAILFSTGYMANMGVIAALTGRGDTVYEDRLNHASLIDGGLLSRATVKRFRHNDIAQLENFLVNDTSRRKLVVVDGVFSMDGDVAALPELSALCEKYQAQLMVDDAHGFGVLGQQGGGCAEHFQLSTSQLPILVGTLGKAFGTFGAFVAGSEALIETLVQFSRPYIYTTALPPSVAAASVTSLSLLQNEHWRREKLQHNIRYFRENIQSLGLSLIEPLVFEAPLVSDKPLALEESPVLQASLPLTPIQPLLLGSDKLVMHVAQQLRDQGVLVGAIRPPTVPEGTGRLRITLNVHHSEQHIDRLLSVLNDVIPKSSMENV